MEEKEKEKTENGPEELIIEEDTVYEIDLECIKRKREAFRQE
ncbi:hypothetical protein [Acetivibrio ethanolgignens]|nr:hypothetical protein [Acetivibrio ethanolgignens]